MDVIGDGCWRHAHDVGRLGVAEAVHPHQHDGDALVASKATERAEQFVEIGIAGVRG